MGSQFLVAGIVNTDALPADKQDVPLGEEGNPIPLAKLTHVVSKAGTGISKHKQLILLGSSWPTNLAPERAPVSA